VAPVAPVGPVALEETTVSIATSEVTELVPEVRMRV
jgi:hypothetical protein